MNQGTPLNNNATMETPFGCIELWAGNELAHRHVELIGLEGDVIAVPAGGNEGGDLYALFSCGGERAARIILADCVGHGVAASLIAAHVHKLIHQFRDVRDSSGLLAALNDEFTLIGEPSGAPLRLTTIVTATFDRETGEFNYAYAAHPRMMLWRMLDRRWYLLGEGLEGLPIGFIAGEFYTQQSIRIEPGDVVLIFSDGATEVFSPDGRFLGHEGFLELADKMMAALPTQSSLHSFAEALVGGIRHFHGSDTLVDDLTLLTLRRSAPLALEENATPGFWKFTRLTRWIKRGQSK
ncbi:MAG: PP2C family protein-serine/threonine phosphatase [Candidatus Acidiferrales bacterium]